MARRRVMPAGALVSPTGVPTVAGRDYFSGIEELSAELSEGSVALIERSADPANPPEGQSVIWQSDGTGAGDDGDIMIKISAGGVTKTATLVDFSAI